MKKMNPKEGNEGYYLSLRQQTNDYHSVHKTGCPFMPDNSRKIYLGTVSSWKNACVEGRKIFDRAYECPFCIKINRNKEKKQLQKSDNSLFPTVEQISRFEKQTIFFILN